MKSPPRWVVFIRITHHDRRNHFTHHHYSILDWRFAEMAVQYDVGLLSKHGPLHHSVGDRRSAGDGPNLESRLSLSTPTYC